MYSSNTYIDYNYFQKIVLLKIIPPTLKVEVIIDGTPSSCRSGECSFSYEDNATAIIDSVYPLEGQGGMNITIYGTGFSDNVDDISVFVGQFQCPVVSANATQIVCTLADHPAGYYDISVLIEGMGTSLPSNITCFRYLLTIESVSPSSGGLSGGVPLTISGNGFLDFMPVPADELDASFSYLPWFKYGLGMPSTTFRPGMGACPVGGASLMNGYNMTNMMNGGDNFTDNENNPNEMSMLPSDCNSENCDVSVFVILLESVNNLFRQFPASVEIGNIPCIITESTVQQLTCIPLMTPAPSRSDINVNIMSESVTLSSSYEILLLETPLISGVSPVVGAVTGGNTITISGSGFGASEPDEVSVTIGRNICNVSTASDSSIECVTSGNYEPSFEAILVSTPNGVAILEVDVSGYGSGSGLDNIPLFPVFEYKLVVYADSAVAGAGSVFGGSEVTLSGGIFAPGETRVFVGSNEAEIIDVTMDMVKFHTPSSSTTHYLTLEVSPFRGLFILFIILVE